MRFNKINNRVVLYKERLNMKQLNNISTPKGRKVFSRRILFFSFFILAVIALALKGWCTEPPQKVQRYDRVARNQRHRLFLSGYADWHQRSS
ncbi:MAG: hypothetical protein BHW08_00260 [Clostridium sp. CAG:12237_41]|nr:MAG: hypothetical protein BHW08_00260 [Clostridium sp. CAG:12237_41]